MEGILRMFKTIYQKRYLMERLSQDLHQLHHMKLQVLLMNYVMRMKTQSQEKRLMRFC